MSLFKYKNSAVWWYDFRFRKRRHRKSTKTRNRQLAEKVERAKRHQLEENYNGIKPIEDEKQVWQLMEEYIERKRPNWSEATYTIAKEALPRLLPHFGKKFPSEIDAKDLCEYQQLCTARDYAASTVNRDMTLLSAVLRRAKVWANIADDFKPLPIPEQYGTALTPAQEKSLLAACAASTSLCLYVIVVLALCTGMRRSEIKFLHWWQVDLENGVLVVGKSKTRNGTGRRILLNERALIVLKEWVKRFPERSPNHFVFPAERYGMKNNLLTAHMVYNTDPNKPIGDWKKSWYTACKKAGVACRFHDLRHTTVTRLAKGRVAFITVARMLGWSPSNMVLMMRKYAHLFDEDLAAAIVHLEGESKGTSAAAPTDNKEPSVAQTASEIEDSAPSTPAVN